MNKNFSRVLAKFSNENAEEPKEIQPYSQYLESIHKTMLASPDKAKEKYDIDSKDYYLVFNNNTELNDGNYDSDSIFNLFGKYLEQIDWDDPDPLHPTKTRGTLDLFYPELNVHAVVTSTEDGGLSIFVPSSEFKSITDKLDSIEIKKDEEESSELEGLEQPQEQV